MGVSSQQSGRTNGLGDAIRHISWATELRRRFPQPIAKFLLDAHEWENDIPIGILKAKKSLNNGNLSTSDAKRLYDLERQVSMDRHNNAIGLELGKNILTVEDGAKKVIEHFNKNPFRPL